MTTPLIAFFGWSVWIAALAFIAFGVLALWVWQKNKNNANKSSPWQPNQQNVQWHPLLT